jgi:hypothetical protein
MNWLGYVIEIVGKVGRSPFVLSVTVSYLEYAGTAAQKYEVFCVFRQISSVTALATDIVTAKLILNYRLHYPLLLMDRQSPYARTARLPRKVCASNYSIPPQHMCHYLPILGMYPR